MINYPAYEIVIPGRIERSQDVRIAIHATNVTIAVGNPGNLSSRTALSGRILRLEMDHGPFALATIRLQGGDLLKTYATRLGTEGLALPEGNEVIAMIKSVPVDTGHVTQLVVC